MFEGCLKKIDRGMKSVRISKIRARFILVLSGVCTPDKITGNQWRLTDRHFNLPLDGNSSGVTPAIIRSRRLYKLCIVIQGHCICIV